MSTSDIPSTEGDEHESTLNGSAPGVDLGNQMIPRWALLMALTAALFLTAVLETISPVWPAKIATALLWSYVGIGLAGELQRLGRAPSGSLEWTWEEKDQQP